MLLLVMPQPPCGRRLVNRYRGPSCYYLSCLSHPAVGDSSIATGGRHVISRYAYEANPAVGGLPSLPGTVILGFHFVSLLMLCSCSY